MINVYMNLGPKVIIISAISILPSIMKPNFSINQKDSRIWLLHQQYNELIIKESFCFEINTVDHNKFINMNIDSILSIYWKERWLDLVREHMLIEINNYRKQFWLSQLLTDSNLNNCAQNYAIYLVNNHESWHFANKTPRERVINSNYDKNKLGSLVENLCYRTISINETLKMRKESKEGHNENLLFEFEKQWYCWIWFHKKDFNTWYKRVFEAAWN